MFKKNSSNDFPSQSTEPICVVAIIPSHSKNTTTNAAGILAAPEYAKKILKTEFQTLEEWLTKNYKEYGQI